MAVPCLPPPPSPYYFSSKSAANGILPSTVPSLAGAGEREARGYGLEREPLLRGAYGASGERQPAGWPGGMTSRLSSLGVCPFPCSQAKRVMEVLGRRVEGGGISGCLAVRCLKNKEPKFRVMQMQGNKIKCLLWYVRDKGWVAGLLNIFDYSSVGCLSVV